jgi:hypothetical protein
VTEASPGAVAGLCATCLHARRIASARGSTFWLCQRSVDDPRFAKYPRLPVVHCAGFEASPVSRHRRAQGGEERS